MKIQIKTLTQSKYEIEVDPSITIGDLKNIIEEKYKHDKEHQVLIFSGKVLTNEMTIESCNVKETDFLVLMVKKIKTTTSTQTTKPATSNQPTQTTTPPIPITSTPTLQPTSPPTSPPTDSKEQTQPEKESSTPSSDPSSTLYSQSASTLVVGTELQAMADKISVMGFPKEQVLVALRASFGNPDRALEYLLNGIPENVLGSLQPPRQQTRPASAPTTGGGATTVTPPRSGTTSGTTGGIQLPANILPPSLNPSLSTGGIQLPVNILPPNLINPNTPPSTSGTSNSTVGTAPVTGGTTGTTTGGTGGGSGLTEFLRNHPAFPQLRQLARTDPDRLRELLTQLLQQNPQLEQILLQHQAEFVDLIREGGGGAPSPTVQIQVTQQDQEAIEHLMGLGFPRNRAMEAYFLFDKDEQMAANYLLNSGQEDDEMAEFIDEVGEGDGDGDDDDDDE